MSKQDEFKAKFLKVNIKNIDVYVFVATAKDIVKIAYVSTRGVDDEDGAVQRLFSKQRIDEIADFVKNGGRFYSGLILNWKLPNLPKLDQDLISFPLEERAAQVLDGQHRLRGLDKAMQEKKEVEGIPLIVFMTLGLSTPQASEIFININSKQQTVSKSLIYDLFTELETEPDHEINRAHDIANYLHTDESSPYMGWIKFPGKPGRRGMLELSTVVEALRPHVRKGGTFENRNLSSLEAQKKLLLNYFSAIKNAYDRDGIWETASQNPFLGSAGFRAAINVLATTLVEKCAAERSFEIKTFEHFLNLAGSELLTRTSPGLKELGGKEQQARIASYLERGISRTAPTEEEYAF